MSGGEIQEEKEMIDFIKDAGMALVWLLLGYFIGESNARDRKSVV